MGDEEMEPFRMTDHDNERLFNLRRPRKKQTQEQAMLGMFADDDSDEADERPSSRRRQKDYSAPISFIAGGIQQAGKPKHKKEKEKNDYDDDDDDDEDRDDGLNKNENGRRRIKNSSSEESDSERPSFSGGEFAGFRSRGSFKRQDDLQRKGIGNWECYTKGVGAKLLLKMGYEPGKGLGKELQGISAPVEVNVRKGRGAIGAYGPEKHNKIADAKPHIEESEVSKPKTKQTTQWKKNSKKSDYSFPTVKDVIEDGRKTKKHIPIVNPDIVKCKVTDMTTPEQRTFTSYNALGKRQHKAEENLVSTDVAKSKKNFALPELQHNLNMIVDMCEQNIIQNDKRNKFLSDRIVSLEAEKIQLSKICDQHAQMIGTLENALALVNKLVDRKDEMTIKEIAESVRVLQERHYEEYKAYSIGELACSFVVPKFKEHLAFWDPFTQPKLPLAIFREWKDILEHGKLNQKGRAMAAYDQLIWNTWMPRVRSAIQNWSCRQPDNLIDLLEHWLPYLPHWIFNNILELIILPKLTNEVEEWDPLTDPIPIHTWIHPWLPLMKSKMDTLIYPVIRRKLGSALDKWHPSDRSARLMLQPWVEVFPKADMDAFLVKNIIPKLQKALFDFVINPHQQLLTEWNWVFDWKDMIPVQMMAAMLDKFFFPKWLQVLGLWLNHSPNYDQVAAWFTGWKNMLSDKLLAEPIIKDHFWTALNLMHKSVSVPQANLLSGSKETVACLMSQFIEQNKAKVSQISQPKIDRFADSLRTVTLSQMPQGFKDLVQKRCEERGLLFMPLPNRYKEGKQIYKIGNVQAIIEGHCVVVSRNGVSWIPMELNTLLDTADIS